MTDREFETLIVGWLAVAYSWAFWLLRMISRPPAGDSGHE